jgi:hypothetical protein
MIENEFFIACPLLSTDQFISYCKDRGIRTSKEQLEQFEKLGIFYPIARVRYPKIKIKIEYIDDGTRYRDLGMLKDGEEWYGALKEEYAHFWFQKEHLKSWLEEGLLWEPVSRPFQSWETFSDEERHRQIESFYSIFQCYTLYNLLQLTRMELGAEWWVTYADEGVNKFIDEVSKWAKVVISDHQKNRTTIEAAGEICQVVSNRYFPETQSDRRTIRISGYYDHRIWEGCCHKWDAKAVFTNIGISTEKLRHLQERIAIDARFADPLEQWYGLISFVSVEQKNKVKDKVLLAQTLYSMEHMLRLFYEDITGNKLRSPDELQDRWKDRFYGHGVTENEMLYLEFLTNEYHLNPRPNLILVVEGDGEAGQFPRLVKELLGYSFSRLGIEVVNIQGVDNFAGEKRGSTKDKYGALERFIDAYHHRQTIVFIVLDNEKRVPNIKKKLTKAPSKYYPKRKVTKDEYIHVWNNNIEFDNFSHEEIAQAMTILGKYEYSFQPNEIEHCEPRNSHRKRDTLSELFEEKLKHGLVKPKLLELLFQFIISNQENEFELTGKGKRPVVQLMQKIIKLAARNYQPATLRSWKETQESGYLGEPIK